ncbi:LCP family protein, partial [Candidatus Parcubacteria bacterium]|nr:LCP family protein [Candidatus Parcubacteria bacterium]
MTPYQPDFNTYTEPTFRQKIKRPLWFLGLLFVAYMSFYLASTGRTVAIENSLLHPFGAFISGDKPQPTQDLNYAMPEKESDRLDILILGIRGQNDPDAEDGGPLLTDSMELFSYNKTTKKSSLVSVPRDLYVTIHDGQKDKLNAAYEWGVNHSNGTDFIKEKMSQITGVYIDK